MTTNPTCPCGRYEQTVMHDGGEPVIVSRGVPSEEVDGEWMRIVEDRTGGPEPAALWRRFGEQHATAVLLSLEATIAERGAGVRAKMVRSLQSQLAAAETRIEGILSESGDAIDQWKARAVVAEEALREIVRMGVKFDARGTHSKRVVDTARSALESTRALDAAARLINGEPGSLEPLGILSGREPPTRPQRIRDALDTVLGGE